LVDLACSVALLAAALSVAAAYARHVTRSGAVHYARIERAGGSPLLSKGMLETGYWALGPAARACVALGVSADAVSWWSLALAGAGGLSIALGHYGVGAVAGAASFVCDALDGMVARATGSASDAGEVLDAAIDRYAELLFLGGIVLHERGDALLVTLALAATAGSMMVSYSTAKAEALGVEPPRGAMRRQERAAYFVLGAALVPLAAAASARWSLPAWVGRLPLLGVLGLVAVVGNVSAVERLRTIAAAVRERDAQRQREPRLARPPSGIHAAADDRLR
jgi:CDP-diacylglycerol--glycerol-3-phosphate 3-phosphatidyltransferase